MANVAALSGLTDGWRRVFRAPDPGRLADVRGTSAEMASAIFQFSETTGDTPGAVPFAAGPNPAIQDAKYPSARVV
jgi:hypothetical protein